MFPNSHFEDLVWNALGLASRCHQYFQCDYGGNFKDLEAHPRKWKIETKAKIAAEAKGLLANINFEFVLALEVSTYDIILIFILYVAILAHG